MNRNQLAAHVAAETSVTRATADSLVGAVFSAIAEAIARDETVAIAGFGKFDVRSRPARTGRNPPDRRARRHRRVEGAIVQAGEGASRRGQRIAGRSWPGACASSRRRRRSRANRRRVVHAEPRHVCRREVNSQMGRFATRANACADQPPTSAASRARVLMWRPAGLLRRPRCGPVRAADAPTATDPLSAADGRAPAYTPELPRGHRCIVT